MNVTGSNQPAYQGSSGNMPLPSQISTQQWLSSTARPLESVQGNIQTLSASFSADVEFNPHDLDYRDKVETHSSTGENGRHFYSIKGEICSTSQAGCNEAYANSVFEHVNKNDVPFTNNDLGSGDRNLLPDLPRPLGNQPIRHQENIPERTSTNVALPGHNFYPGDVKHQVFFEEGKLYYEVVGTGNGSLPSFNNTLGVQLFRPGVDQVVKMFGR